MTRAASRATTLVAGLLVGVSASEAMADPTAPVPDSAVTSPPPIEPVAAAESLAPIHPDLVVVLRPPSEDEVTEMALARVTGELAAAHFRVLLMPLEPRDDPAREVETIAAEQGPVAAMAIARVQAAAGEAVAIWTCDRKARRTSILRLPLTIPDAERQAAVLAIEAVELIRARVSGMNTELPSPVRLADPKASGTDGAWFGAMNHTRVSVGAGAAAMWDVGLGGPAWSATLWGGFRPTRNLTLTGRVTALGSALTAEAPAGTADVHRDLGSLGLAWTFARLDHVEAFISLAGGIEQIHAEGMAPSPAEALSQTSWSPLALGGAGARAHLTNRLALVVAAEGTFSLRRQSLLFDDVKTHPLSRPGILVHAGIEATTF